MSGPMLGYRLQTAADMQFVTDVDDMRANGGDTDVELVADFLVNETLSQQFNHLSFAVGQIFSFLRRNTDQMKMAHNFTRDRTGHRGSALIDVPNGSGQLIGRI